MEDRTPLTTHRLGTTDLEVTTVGFGAWEIGGGGWVYGWGPQDEASGDEGAGLGIGLGELAAQRPEGAAALAAGAPGGGAERLSAGRLVRCVAREHPSP